MKIERVLNINSEEFYDYLEEKVMTEMNDHVGNNIQTGDIKKGLRYTKQPHSQVESISVEILDYSRGETYQSRLSTSNDTFKIQYFTEPMENKLKITFVQEVESLGNPRISKPLKMFSELIYYGRMANDLYKLQASIIKQREE